MPDPAANLAGQAIRVASAEAAPDANHVTADTAPLRPGVSGHGKPTLAGHEVRLAVLAHWRDGLEARLGGLETRVGTAEGDIATHVHDEQAHATRFALVDGRFATLRDEIIAAVDKRFDARAAEDDTERANNQLFRAQFRDFVAHKHARDLDINRKLDRLILGVYGGSAKLMMLLIPIGLTLLASGAKVDPAAKHALYLILATVTALLIVSYVWTTFHAPPPGPQGDTGEAGSQGVAGPRGLVGPAGHIGQTGDTGATGASGESHT